MNAHPDASTLPPVLTVDEVAALLRVNRKTVYEAFRSRKLPGRKIGRCVRFDRDALLNWLRADPRDRP